MRLPVPKPVQPLGDRLLISNICRMIKGPSLNLIRQILLFYIMLRKIMGIEVAGSMSQFFRAFIMPVLQVGRYRCRNAFHCVHSRKDSAAGRIALRRAGHIGNRMCQNDLRF